MSCRWLKLPTDYSDEPFFDCDVNVGLQVRDSVMIYTGVRYLQMDTRPGKREVDDRLHVGVRWTLG